MNKILSQDEIDALLKGVSSGEVETEAKAEDESGVKSYDLTSQERIVRGRMPGLEMCNERFARLFRNSISSIIMKFVDVSINSVEMVKFGEFMKTMPLPSSINIFKMEPLKGFSLFVIGAPMVFAFVECFFGGATVRYVKAEGRYFTVIEQKIIKNVVELALADLAGAWHGLSPVQPEIAGSEMNPQFVTIVTPTEVVIKIEIQIEIEDFTGKVFFCIPYSVIEPIKEKLYSGIQGDRQEVDHRLVAKVKEILMDSNVNLRVNLGEAQLTIEEIMDLKVGDVVTLGNSVGDPVELLVENVPKYKVVPGLSKGNQSIKITNFIES